MANGYRDTKVTENDKHLILERPGSASCLIPILRANRVGIQPVARKDVVSIAGEFLVRIVFVNNNGVIVGEMETRNVGDSKNTKTNNREDRVC